MKIKFDYHKAMRQAEKIDNIACSLKKLSAHELQETLECINYAWEGNASQTYRSKLEEKQTNIEQVSKNLEALAEQYRQIARSLKQAEENAKKALSTNTYR